METLTSPTQRFRQWYEWGRQFIFRLIEHDVSGRAAQLAFFFLLSLFPLLIFVVTLLPYTPLTQEDIFNFLKEFAPQGTLTVIESTLNEVMQHRSGKLLSLGVIGTLWSASNGMNALMRSLNQAYHVEEGRPYFIARGLSVILTIVVIFVFILALLVPVFGEHLAHMIISGLELSDGYYQVWSFIRWTLTPIILFLIFLGMYYVAPSIRIQFITAAPGALFASVGWLIVSYGFSYYVANFGNYSATYGSIGGIIVLMLWFYLSGIIIIIGGEINSFIKDNRQNRGE